MGSWSESCGLSGIEVGEGEVAYVGFLGKPKYAGSHGASTDWEFKTPLLRGKYNDYGYLHVEDDEAVIALFNEHSGLSLKNGDDFADRDEHLVPDMRRYWVRGDVLEALEKLTPEFPYFWPRSKKVDKHVRFKNIGEFAELRLADVRAALAKAKEAKEKWNALLASLPKPDMSEHLDVLMDLNLRDVFGYGLQGVNWCELMNTAIGDDAKLEALLTAYRRDVVLEYAAVELRKKFAPSECIGPQHSGEVASCQFARSILAIQKQRKKRWD